MYLLAVFLGGGLGSLARFGVTSATKSTFPNINLPLGTILSNLLACLVLGVVFYLVKDKLNTDSFLIPFLIVGFCGGFSTFSTFSLESVQLVQNKMYLLAGANILISVISCFLLLLFIARQRG